MVSGRHSAQQLYIENGFNINSLSVPAWRAVSQFLFMFQTSGILKQTDYKERDGQNSLAREEGLLNSLKNVFL